MKHAPIIGLVDDEPGLLKALQRQFVAEGFGVATFSSADDFLRRFNSGAVDCLVLDVSMPGQHGQGFGGPVGWTGAGWRRWAGSAA